MEVIGTQLMMLPERLFDKCGKVMGFYISCRPLIDKLAKEGNILAFQVAKPRINGLTSVLAV